ncbi:MAG: helix-turn-helix transcriptional regulator [Actinobacteria bacterium]|nr:helix-turn-helix transcriptional regulator [Actinomycetota bacterium]
MPKKSTARLPRSAERGPGVAPAPEEAGAAALLIREARLRRDFSQREIAERSGFDQGLISRWERGRVQPSFEAVLKVLGACGYDLWVALSLVNRHGSSTRTGEMRLLDEPTPPDGHGFRRQVRAQDAEVRRERRARNTPRGG